jgi:hypothetical protein
VDQALAEIERMPGKHVYFLDDHLLGNPRFARALFYGMRGMGRVFQGASTVDAILRSDLIEHAAAAGMRSVFVGLETINEENLRLHAKRQNLARDYDEVVRRVHDLGIMINASFVFGLDDDGPDVFDRTVEWAVSRSIETATFHIMTPYPGTALHDRVSAEGRITDLDWDHYDTRHVVYRPLGMAPDTLLEGYHRAYREFYAWGSIFRGAFGQATAHRTMRHLAYAGGWKRLEPLWDAIIRSRRVSAMLPLLEATLDAFGRARRGEGERDGARSEHARAGEDGTRIERSRSVAQNVSVPPMRTPASSSRGTAGWGPGTAAPIRLPEPAARRIAKATRTKSASGAIDAWFSQRPGSAISRHAQPTAAS